jgi:hypothetical protein
MEPEPTLEEIHTRGLLALRKELGQSGMIRFIRSATPGLILHRWNNLLRCPVSAKRRKNALDR